MTWLSSKDIGAGDSKIL